MKPETRNPKPETEAVGALCPACGMCCNGVLFADVELQRGDDAARLQTLGVKLFAKGGRRRFGQPCGCFDGMLCRIYADRPDRCRTFECRLLKNVRVGVTQPGRALRSIAAAVKAVNRIRRLVGELGETDETQPLSRRYARTMAQPIDFGGDSAVVKRRSALMRAVDQLAKRLERDFLT